MDSAIETIVLLQLENTGRYQNAHPAATTLLWQEPLTGRRKAVSVVPVSLHLQWQTVLPSIYALNLAEGSL